MRVSTTYMHIKGVQNMLDQQEKLMRTQEQLSLGKKNLVPSDDPSAASRVLDLNDAITTMDQYQENADFAKQRLNLEETTLDGTKNVLQRIRELTIQAANTGLNDLQSERIIAQEIRENLDEIYGYANTRDASGEYLFSGFQSGTQAFTKDSLGNYQYNGDQGQLALQIGSNRQVVSNNTGAEIFQHIRTGNGTFSVDSDRTNSGSGIISTGSLRDPGAYQPHDFTIQFTATDTYDVVNNTTGATVLAGQTYSDGGVIAFNGIEVDIKGAPDINDSFSVQASRNQDVFTSVSNLIRDMETPASGNVRGSFGGAYTTNGFDVGDTVSFDMVFDGRTVGASHTVVGGDTDLSIATALLTDPANGINADANVTDNGDGTYTLAGTSPGMNITFQLNGSDISFVSRGGDGTSSNSLVINNVADDDGSTLGNNASMTLTNSGSSLVSAATITVGGNETFLPGASNDAFLSQQFANALNNIDRAIENIIDVQTSIGGRINSIDSQMNDNEAKVIQLQAVRSDIEDIDYAEATSNLTFQTTALQIAQQTFVTVQNLSLFNFI
ncbi:MAG: flagellar hook-associated protein FlgL [Gammaproteobacteria bacterium]|nr:flagellar hook-associated protein FlgL [Gammaproteobacteria bacterium]